MKLNFKKLIKFLIPIIGLAVLGSFYRYKYVLNPDGLRNSKGDFYADNYRPYLDDSKFVNKCLSFEQDDSAISYGEIYNPPKIPGLDNSLFVRQRVTLRGYGSLINSCRHDVVIERISMTREIGDSGKQGTYGGEDSYYPNEGFIAEEDKDFTPENKIFYPNGNILKANSSLKIELASTDWFKKKPTGGFDVAIPEKNTPIKFELKKESESLNLWYYSLKLNKDNYDEKKLAEDGLAEFRIFFENPHGKRSIAFTPNECIVFINGKVLDDGCNVKKWQFIKNGNLILNSKDFGKYLIK